jgi:transketolase
MDRASSLAVRRHILECSAASGHGHIPTSFSVVEMILATYAQMRHFPDSPRSPERDIFILSKGHAALGYYCCLAELGYFPWEEVKTFGRAGTRFGCHPDRLKCEGVEVSSGSLGHGIAVGVGMALAFQIQKNRRRVFALVGDGEANEGSVWESIMIAVDRKLANFTVLYDHNRSQTRCLQIENPAERFISFGCHVAEVDGHDLSQIAAALKTESGPRPKVIVCRTVKGFGSATLASHVFEWHRRSPKAAELDLLLGELNAQTI